ncbi:MAG: tyrosine-type recombinase/integrase [Neisseriaceae bacterium]
MTIDEFKQAANSFLQELKFNGMSLHTQKAYRRDLMELFELLLGAAAVTTDSCQTIDKSYFTWAIKKLSLQNRHPSTISRKVSVWRKYNRYLLEQKLTDQDYLTHLKVPKIPARLPKAVDAETLNQAFDYNAIEDREPFFVQREQAMFELMYGSGLRVSEVEALNLKDIELDAGWVTVRGKGEKTRHIPLTSKSVVAIKDYLKLRPQIKHQEALFVSRLGRRITSRRIQQNLNQWAIRHECARHLSPHVLRHSFATQVLQNSQNIRAVQELLGHRQLSTTQIYTKLDFAHLATVYDQTHPRAKKNKK